MIENLGFLGKKFNFFYNRTSRPKISQFLEKDVLTGSRGPKTENQCYNTHPDRKILIFFWKMSTKREFLEKSQKREIVVFLKSTIVYFK